MPFKPWRVVSKPKRLSAELNKHGCSDPEGHRHDPIVGGDMAQKSGSGDGWFEFFDGTLFGNMNGKTRRVPIFIVVRRVGCLGRSLR